MNRIHLKGLAMVLATLVPVFGTAQADTPVLGWVEEVAVQDSNLVLPAKIDTGADNSSIGVSDIEYVTRDDETLVRFRIKDTTSTFVSMERPLVRMGQIKRKEGGYIERPVVMLGLCIAGQQVNAEVNLANRDHFKYPVLIGRSTMARHFVVDPERTHLTRPVCGTAWSMGSDPMIPG